MDWITEIKALTDRCLFREAQWYYNFWIYQGLIEIYRLTDLLDAKNAKDDFEVIPDSASIRSALFKARNLFFLRKYRQVCLCLANEKAPEAIFLRLYAKFIVKSTKVEGSLF